ncbi:MAG: dehydratase [Chloroflexi bacterium]|nr:dehydratase [Chloroflexota bacterium]
MSVAISPQGLYFEQFEIGQKFATVGRTVTEADVVNFAGISGDFNQVHTDLEYSRKSSFGTRVAHGLLVLSIASGLILRTGILEGTVMAFREINDWKFVKPALAGDTISAEIDITARKPFPRLNGGAVTIRINVRNQAGETVMKGDWVALVRMAPAT